MDVLTSQSRIVVTCNQWIVPYLRAEIDELSLPAATELSAGVETRGSIADCIRLNLNLRCASQVLYSLRRFQCRSPEDLYQGVVSIPWHEIIPENGYFSVASQVRHPSIRSGMFANLKVKDAIVDQIRGAMGKRPDCGPDRSRAVVNVHWVDEFAEVLVDTSGDSLAKHGYRKNPGKAPMMESLAAATILATCWDRNSPFINPMCGSGTLAIEAALIATNRRPGLFRDNYAFMHLAGYDKCVFRREKEHLKSLIRQIPGLNIVATDIDADAIEIARANAVSAGLGNLIQFSVCDFQLTPVPSNGPGVVMINPEYGERLGDETTLGDTYARIGDFFKKSCQGCTGYVFTANLELAKRIGLRTKRRIPFSTAKLECRLLEFELYAGSRRKRDRKVDDVVDQQDELND